MATKYADIRIMMTVEFEDDEEMELGGQAIDAAREKIGWLSDADIDLVGPVRDTERPPQGGWSDPA